jgi:hypothetical protein
MHVIQIISVLLLFLIIYLSVYSAIGKPHKSYYIVENGQQNETYYFQCKDEISGFAAAIYITEVIIMISGAYLSHKTRNVPDAVNESKNIGIGNYFKYLKLKFCN